MRKMKDSGIEWIGEIPEGWDVRRIKYCATLNGRIGWQGLTSAEYSDEGAFLITGINFKNGHIDWDTCVHVPMSRWEEATQIQIQNGDLLITKDGTVGKVAIVSDMPGATSLNSGVLLIRNYDYCQTRYLYWILLSSIFWKWFSLINAGNSTITHLYQYDFMNFSFPLPPLPEQQRIADYLDALCGEIDSAIEKQTLIIEKLREYKRSLITQVVTKGLNPKAKMKESGIDWIGEIPEGWEVRKIKNIFYTSSGTTPSSDKTEYWDGDIAWITPADFKTEDKFVIQGRRNITKIGFDSCSLTLIPQNSIVFSKRAPIGSVVITANELCINQGCLSCITKSSNDIIYYYYLLSVLKEQFELFGSGTTFKEISLTSFNNFQLPFPPLSEQQQIADYLDDKCSKIDAVIAKKQTLIEKLTEYKKSLIYEVVTGKREI